jgi:hypothetical protein
VGARVMAALAVSSDTAVQVNDSTVALGVTTPGKVFTLKTAQGTVATSPTFQSGLQNTALVTNPAATGGALTHQLKFTEGFATSFRKRNTATTVATPSA